MTTAVTPKISLTATQGPGTHLQTSLDVAKADGAEQLEGAEFIGQGVNRYSTC